MRTLYKCNDCPKRFLFFPWTILQPRETWILTTGGPRISWFQNSWSPLFSDLVFVNISWIPRYFVILKNDIWFFFFLLIFVISSFFFACIISAWNHLFYLLRCNTVCQLHIFLFSSKCVHTHVKEENCR